MGSIFIIRNNDGTVIAFRSVHPVCIICHTPLAEIFVFAIISPSIFNEKRQLYYWQREKSGSSAEVDYIIEQEGKVVLVEVKSGSTGKILQFLPDEIFMFVTGSNTQHMKIISVVGARPNFMKIAPFMRAIGKHNKKSGKKVEHLLVHTGRLIY